MTKYGADKGHLTADGGFVSDGTYGTLHPAGTGQFKFSSWKVGDKLEIVRNDSYWGKKAILRRVIFRPIADNAARLQALQTGEIQGYDLVEPQDIATIEGDSELQIIDRPATMQARRYALRRLSEWIASAQPDVASLDQLTREDLELLLS